MIADVPTVAGTDPSGGARDCKPPARPSRHSALTTLIQAATPKRVVADRMLDMSAMTELPAKEWRLICQQFEVPWGFRER